MIEEFYQTMTSFSPRGRATREEYRNFFMHWSIISVALFVVCLILYVFSFSIKIKFSPFQISQMGEISSVPLSILVGLGSVFFIFEIWSAIIGGVLTIKRLHDLNLSGIYYWVLTFSMILLCIAEGGVLTGFLAYIITGCVLFLLFADSYPFSNKYDIIGSKKFRLTKEKIHGKISVYKTKKIS